MALIEQEPLRTKAVECGKLAKQDPRLLVVGLGHVLEAPTIDAVKVVRCGECRYFAPNNLCRLCGHVGGLATPRKTDFCSYGEKREEVQ